MKKLSYMLLLIVLGSVSIVSAQTRLNLTIDVKADKDERRIGQGYTGKATMEQVKVNVFIRQRSGALYTDPLKAELYVIGKQIQSGFYGIIDVVKKDFTFTEENDKSFTFNTGLYQIGKTSGNIDVGGEYVTYLLVVTDQNGEIIETRSGKRIKDKGIEFIRTLGPMTLFDKDGNVTGKVENPGEAFKAAVPAAVSGSGSNRGR